MNKNLLSDYWKKVCESDAAWDLFCKFPQDITWKNYEESKKSELAIFEKLPKHEQLKILQND